MKKLIVFSFCAIVSIAFTLLNAQESARGKLLNYLAGEWVSRGIYAATKLEIPEHLQSGAKSVAELAVLTQTHPESLHRMLHMLAGVGIFEEVAPETYANTEMSRLLMKKDEDSLHSISLFYGEDLHRAWAEVAGSVQTGIPAFDLTYKQPVFQYFKENPERAVLFQEAMKEKSKAVIKSSLSTYDFSRHKCICDVGGGYGQFIQALLQKHPHLSGVIFELPEVIQKIRQQAPQLESSRCQLVAGDFFHSIPSGSDAYLLKSVIHDWDDPKSEIILKNCHKVMGPHDRLLIVDIVIYPGDQSVFANCMDFLMLAITGGKERSLASMTQLLTHSGFVVEAIYPTATEFSIIEAKKM